MRADGLEWGEGYSKDMEIARQIDRERRQRFARAMMAISQYVYQQQMLNALNRPRTCTATHRTHFAGFGLGARHNLGKSSRARTGPETLRDRDIGGLTWQE